MRCRKVCTDPEDRTLEIAPAFGIEYDSPQVVFLARGTFDLTMQMTMFKPPVMGDLDRITQRRQ